jgi:hypothetical protein
VRYWKDRHPDHAATGHLIRNAAVYCTLKKSSDPNPPHRPSAYLYYLLHHFTHPGIVVDISEVYDRKLEPLRMHASQFSKTAEGFGVLPLGMSDYLFGLESRDRFFGSLIGVHRGKAFMNEDPLKRGSIIELPLLCQSATALASKVQKLRVAEHQLDRSWEVSLGWTIGSPIARHA